MYQKISGKVIEGKRLGKTIGFPTANIEIGGGESGTYKINVILEGKKYSGVGTYLSEKKLFESHIFDFNEDIYGKNIEVYVLQKIRENKKFESLDELKVQISKDIEFAKNNEIVVMTFGTFDFFHKGHKYFLNESKNFGYKLITIVARDENVLKIKGFKPHFSQEERRQEIIKSGISDEVYIGKKDNPISWLLDFKPKVICLGYDQKGFSDLLEGFIKDNNLDIKIIRIEPYKPEIYKSSILKKNLLKN